MKKMTQLFALLALFTITHSAVAEEAKENFETKHPRRTQVNKRINNQKKRIHEEARDGKLSDRQADKLEKRDNQIKHEEMHEVRENEGSMTKDQQKKVNSQLNKTEKKLHSEKHEIQPAVPADGVTH